MRTFLEKMTKYIEAKVKKYLKELDEANNVEEKRKIVQKFSKEYDNVEIGPHSTLSDYRSAILHLYFRNFYDKDTFVKDHFYSCALSICQSTEERAKIMDPNSNYNFSKAKFNIRDGYTVYTNHRRLSEFFLYCQTVINKEKSSTLPICVEISLSVILASVVRCYSVEIRAFIKVIRLIKKQHLLSIKKFEEVHNLSSIDAVFQKFCNNFKKKNEYSYISDLINTTLLPGDEGLSEKKSKAEAVKEFMSTFDQIKNTSLYLISFDSSVVNFVDFLCITLYSQKILLVDCSKSFNGDDLYLWYTFVLIHKLFHQQRLKKSNFDVERSPPKSGLTKRGSIWS